MLCYSQSVIRSFRHKGLRQMFESGQSPKVAPGMQARCLRLLDVLNGAAAPNDMNLPGFHFNKLHGNPERCSVRVTGNWRLTFGWSDGDALDLNLEDYH
jgi:proteic killer suppression protein